MKKELGKQFEERLAIIQDLSNRAVDKDFLNIQEDMISYVCLCLFKANRRHF